jgi:hypothetical protein
MERQYKQLANMKFLEFFKGNIIKDVGNIVDNLVTTDAERIQLKDKLSTTLNSQLLELAEMQKEVIVTEMGGNWLQRSWRPLIMLSFGAIVCIGAFRHIEYLDNESKFWDLLELGLGGYVIGRSVEKVTETISKNLDKIKK